MTTHLPSVTTLQQLVDDVLMDVDASNNPYFRHLVDGSFSREDFLETQRQFHAAVVFFHRPMAALAAKIPDPALRLEILRNVWEENGEGDISKAHGATFVTFLSRLEGRSEALRGGSEALRGGSEALRDCSEAMVRAELEACPLWPEVRAFNTVLVGACVVDDPLVGAGTMGIIERMFSEISSWIGRACVARGFIAEGDMIHYDLHEHLDVRHATDFFRVLGASWDAGPQARADIEQGLRMGALVFDQLYARLYRARQRRWRR